MACEHIKDVSTLARERGSTQGVLAREHVSTQGTMTREHRRRRI